MVAIAARPDARQNYNMKTIQKAVVERNLRQAPITITITDRKNEGTGHFGPKACRIQDISDP